MPKHVQKLANKILDEPEHIRASGKAERPPSLVKQFVMICTQRQRVEAIEKLLLAWQPNAAIIFCKTRNRVETVADILRPKGAEALHGGMSQAERTRVMNRFREGRTNVLVATDVASRGIDVDRVDLILQDDLPTDDDTYIHRVGRTGRAGRTGRSVLMVGNRAVRHIKRIEKKAGSLEQIDVPTQQDIDDMQRAQLVQQFNEIEPQQTAFDAFNAARESGMSAEKIAIAALSKLLDSSSEQEATSTPQVNKSDNGPKAALVLGLGAMDGIDRGAITGMVYRVGNLPDGSVGRIEMLDKITAVELPEEFIDFVQNPPLGQNFDPINKRGSVFIKRSLKDALKNSDAVMTLRLQKERMKQNMLTDLDSYYAQYGITHESLKWCEKKVPVLHPGPVNRGVEISNRLVEDNSINLISKQVENGIPTRMALLYLLGLNKKD